MLKTKERSRKTRRIEALNDSVWDTVKKFRSQGHPWIQIQKFCIHDVYGLAVVDRFDEPNLVFQKMDQGEILSAKAFDMGLTVALAGQRNSRSFITDCIHRESDISSLERRLHAFFDLYVCLAVTPEPHPSDLSEDYQPRLLESTVATGCLRLLWRDSVHLTYPNARIIEYHCGNKDGLWRALQEIERACLYQNWSISPDLMEFKDELPWRPKTLGYHIANSDQVIRPYEDRFVQSYFHKKLKEYYVQLKDWRWNTSLPGNELWHETRKNLSKRNLECYTTEVYDAVMQDCYEHSQPVKTRRGKTEHVHVWT